MKKLLCAILLLTMIFVMAACNGNGGKEGKSNEVEISIANYDTTNSFTVQCIQKFIDYATEKSNGTITFKSHFGGSLCSMQEEYEYLKSGSVDLIAVIPPFCMSELPYVYAVNNVKDDADIPSYTNWLWFENQETASIIDKYCTKEGVKLLGSVDAGTSILCTNYKAESFKDMEKGHLGCARDFDVYQALKLNPVNVDPTEAYDSLSRGVCDGYSYTPSSYYSNSIYQVAPYCLNMKVYGNSNTYMMSLDKWNSLSGEQQQIIRDAMKAAQDFSVTENINSVDAAKGVASEWNELSEAESKEICTLMETAVSQMLLESAEKLGTTEDMLTILKAKEEHTGIECIPKSYRQ